MTAEWCVIVEHDWTERCVVAFKAKPPSGAEWMRHLMGAEMLEHTTWEMSNHQSGDLWLDEEGKLKGGAPCGAITTGYGEVQLLDQLIGPLVLTGKSVNGEISLMDEATANLLVECLNGYGLLRVMGGYFMQLARTASC